jgi:hypothetical protein
MKAFKLFLLAALLLGAFPAVSGACDGLFGRAFDRFTERRTQSVFGFGIIKARTARIVIALPAAIVKTAAKPLQSPALKCADGKCYEK